MPILKPKNRTNIKNVLLSDTFAYPLAAGAVNGSRCTPADNVNVIGPTPNTRVVTDTENKLSISGGLLTFAGGMAAPAYEDLAIWYPAVASVLGRCLFLSISAASYANYLHAGYGETLGADIGNGKGFRIHGTIDPIVPGITQSGVFVLVDGTAYRICVVARTNGMFLFVRDTSWQLIWLDNQGPLVTAYPGIMNYNAAFTADDIIIPAQLWLPSPSAYDSFVRGDAALGFTDGLGPEPGGGGKTWLFDSGIWAIATNVAVGQADATVSKQFATINAGTVNTFTSAKLAACAAGKVGGVVVRLDDPANPLNLVKAVFDGSGNVVITEVVAGTPAALATVAKAFTASDTLTLAMNGAAWRCYHVTNAGAATLIGSGATNVTTGMYCGLHATDNGPTFNGFNCWATGNEGQYTILDLLGA